MKSYVCKRCKRPLSAHESVERGIGPVCVNKEMAAHEEDGQMDLFGNSFIYSFKGFGIHPSKCKVDVFEKAGYHVVVFTDIGMGTSVTNASEQLASEIVQLRGLDPERTKFYERYHPGTDDETLDEITYQWHGLRASRPKWKPVEKNEPKLLYEH